MQAVLMFGSKPQTVPEGTGDSVPSQRLGLKGTGDSVLSRRLGLIDNGYPVNVCTRTYGIGTVW